MLGSFLNVAGLIVGVIGVIATIVVAVRFAHRKDPRVFASTDQKVAILPDAPQDIQISFRGAPVPRVSATLVWFWNHGRAPILASDVPPTQPIELQIISNEPVDILDVRIRKVSRSSIAFAATQVAPDRIRLSFAFLDAGDGAVLEVEHTGGGDAWTQPEGVILGAPGGIRFTADAPPPRDPEYRTLGRHRKPSLPRARSVLLRLVASLFVVGFFGGAAALLLSTKDSFRTTPYRLEAALSGMISPDSVPTVVGRLRQGETLPSARRVLRIAVAVLSLLILAAFMVLIWSSEHPYPRRLALASGDTGLEHGPTQPPDS